MAEGEKLIPINIEDEEVGLHRLFDVSHSVTCFT